MSSQQNPSQLITKEKVQELTYLDSLVTTNGDTEKNVNKLMKSNEAFAMIKILEVEISKEKYKIKNI